MISVNFGNMANQNGYSLDEVFPGNTPGLVAFRGNTRADYVMMWDSENQVYKGTRYFLYVSATTNSPAVDFTWRQSATVASPLKLKSGDSLWFYHQGTETVTVSVSGEVEFTATTTPKLPIYPGMNLIAAPYAAGLNLKLKDADYWKNSGAVAFRGNTRADYIMRWDSEHQVYNGTRYFLYVSATTNSPAADFTWRQSATVAAPDTIEDMGKGLWYYHQGDKSFELELPYPYDLSK